LLTTQVHKIQGSKTNKIGTVHPVVSQVMQELGLPTDAATDFMGVGINYRTWAASYTSYLVEHNIFFAQQFLRKKFKVVIFK